MSEIDTAATHGKDAFACPHCGAYAKQSWGILFSYIDDAEQRLYSVGREWSAAQCQRCYDYSLWLGEGLTYPPATLGEAPSLDMPEGVRELYNEARTVAAVSRRAGAAMARATLEKLVKHVDPEAPAGATLVQRLDRIVPAVDSALGQMLTFVRHVGNAIHVSDQPDDAVVMVLDDDQTAAMELIFATINNLVEEKITRPRIAAELYAKIPEGVRKRVEQQAQISP